MCQANIILCELHNVLIMWLR